MSAQAQDGCAVSAIEVRSHGIGHLVVRIVRAGAGHDATDILGSIGGVEAVVTVGSFAVVAGIVEGTVGQGAGIGFVSGQSGVGPALVVGIGVWRNGVRVLDGDEDLAVVGDVQVLAARDEG